MKTIFYNNRRGIYLEIKNYEQRFIEDAKSLKEEIYLSIFHNFETAFYDVEMHEIPVSQSVDLFPKSIDIYGDNGVIILDTLKTAKI